MPEQTKQAMIPGTDGGSASSGKVIDLSDMRADAPPGGAAGSVTEYTKQEREELLVEIEAEQKKLRRGRPPKTDQAAPETGEKKAGRPQQGYSPANEKAPSPEPLSFVTKSAPRKRRSFI